MQPYPFLYLDRPYAFNEGQAIYVVNHARLRQAAGLSAFTVRTVVPDTPATISAAPPVESDGLIWWPVAIGDDHGWVAESAADGSPLLAAISVDAQRQVIFQEAERLDISPAVALAVFSVESAPADIPSAHMPLNFEPHILSDYLFANAAGQQAKFGKHFRYGSPPWTNQQWCSDGSTWLSLGAGQHNERLAINLACRHFGREAALRATSMGPGQIMGFNHNEMGYPNACAMFDDWRANRLAAVRGFFRYIEWAELLHWLQRQDWGNFARWYNGEGNMQRYAETLAKAVAYAKERV